MEGIRKKLSFSILWVGLVLAVCMVVWLAGSALGWMPGNCHGCKEYFSKVRSCELCGRLYCYDCGVLHMHSGRVFPLRDARGISAVVGNRERISMGRKTEEFNEGAMWEAGPWEIAYDVEITKCSDITPCRHCGETYQKEHKRTLRHAEEAGIPRSWFTTEFRCPRVVIAKNDAGHATTGVCLDCILEAAEALAVRSNEAGGTTEEFTVTLPPPAEGDNRSTTERLLGVGRYTREELARRLSAGEITRDEAEKMLRENLREGEDLYDKDRKYCEGSRETIYSAREDYY